MIRYILVAIILVKSLFAVNLLTYTVYNRENRVDLMLTFDEPYTGKIKKRKLENYTIIKLYDVNYKEEVKKNIDSPIVDEIDIIPRKKSVYIFFRSKNDIEVKVNKTVDNYGLRLRAVLFEKTPVEPEPMPVVAPLSSEEKKTDKKEKDEEFKFAKSSSISVGYGYYITLLLLILVALILYLLRDKIQNKSKSGGWLFSKKRDEGIEIRFQKPIDSRNRVALIDYKNRSYLVLIGNTNVLLDKFGEKSIKKEEEFEDIFEKNRQRLDEYLKLNDEKFQSYKDKVSKDIEKLLK
ncbi:MAG: hypothetical protein GXO31_05210 [Epsilonproteobacteria bacterium]|nr:hypothetical protein [Campylobacterota bacterium]